MPTISVIMGVYNVKDFEELDRSIQSIIHQSYTDWELIICDDGSTNDTFSRLKSYQLKDSRIRVIGYEKNMSLGNALNTCLQYATGDFIARQDADDYADSERFEKELTFLNTHKEVAFVGCNAYVYNSDGIWGEHIRPEYPNTRDFLFRSQFLHPTLLIRKDVLNKVNGYRVVPETKKAEDYDLFMRLYAAGYKGYNIQDKLYYYKVEIGDGSYRTFHDRFDEAKVRKYCFKKMGFGVSVWPYIVKPVVLGLIPKRLFKTIRKSGFS